MITCSDAVRQLWEYLDRALDAQERERIEEHLGLCLRCCGEVEFARERRRFLRASVAADLPPEVHDRLSGFLDSMPPAGTKAEQ